MRRSILTPIRTHAETHRRHICSQPQLHLLEQRILNPDLPSSNVPLSLLVRSPYPTPFHATDHNAATSRSPESLRSHGTALHTDRYVLTLQVRAWQDHRRRRVDLHSTRPPPGSLRPQLTSASSHTGRPRSHRRFHAGGATGASRHLALASAASPSARSAA